MKVAQVTPIGSAKCFRRERLRGCEGVPKILALRSIWLAGCSHVHADPSSGFLPGVGPTSRPWPVPGLLWAGSGGTASQRKRTSTCCRSQRCLADAIFGEGLLSGRLYSMRDPARIDEILAALRVAWQESPDLRLGQLIVDAIRPTQPCPEVFHVQDEGLLERLTEYHETMGGARQVMDSGRSRHRNRPTAMERSQPRLYENSSGGRFPGSRHISEPAIVGPGPI